MDKSYFDKETNTMYFWPGHLDAPIASYCFNEVKIQQITNDQFYIFASEGFMSIGPNGLFVINKYGDKVDINADECKVMPNHNKPTYDELYEHWLKTK